MVLKKNLLDPGFVSQDSRNHSWAGKYFSNYFFPSGGKFKVFLQTFCLPKLLENKLFSRNSTRKKTFTFTLNDFLYEPEMFFFFQFV